MPGLRRTGIRPRGNAAYRGSISGFPIVPPQADGLRAAAEALGQPIFTVVDTVEELNEMVRDAVVCHFEEASRPKIIRLHFVREELIAV